MRVDQARASHEGAQDMLSKTTVRAPIDGIVTAKRVEEGEVAVIGIQNSPGTVTGTTVSGATSHTVTAMTGGQSTTTKSATSFSASSACPIRLEPSNSAGFGGIGPLVSTRRFGTSVSCNSSIAGDSPTRQLVKPFLFRWNT